MPLGQSFRENFLIDFESSVSPLCSRQMYPSIARTPQLHIRSPVLATPLATVEIPFATHLALSIQENRKLKNAQVYMKICRYIPQHHTSITQSKGTLNRPVSGLKPG
jgi:hypothetical protein